MNDESDKPPSKTITPRGIKVMLPHGGLPEVISPYLLKLISQTGGIKGPIGLQFVAQPSKEKKNLNKGVFDPLSEDHHEVAPGLVYKYKGKLNNKGELVYPGRVLWTITRFCCSYCRFCTRGREVGIIKGNGSTQAAITQKNYLDDKDIKTVLDYLKKHREINEIILSGGDPLAAPEILIKALKVFSDISQIKIIRIGTRVPVSEPKLVTPKLLAAFKKVKQPLYILIHFENADELTKETVKAITALRKSGAIIFSQTVFLAGVNDSVKVLYKLFSSLIEVGVKPYYIFRCDPVSGTEKFRVPFEKEVEIMTELRSKLSGLACPLYVIDSPNGSGKIPVPLNFWKFDKSGYKDFNGDRSEVI